MEQWEAENWRKKIELTVIKPVLAAVQSVAPDIQGVDFDLQNDAVIIDSPTVLIDDQWKRVQEIGEEKVRSIVGCTSPIRIRQLRRSTFAYTLHGPSDAIRNPLPQRHRFFDSFSDMRDLVIAILIASGGRGICLQSQIRTTTASAIKEDTQASEI